MTSAPSPLIEMKGVSELIQCFERHIAITPKGVLGFMAKGMKGTKELPYRSIVAVQFKEAGAVFSGYLQFTISGGNESKGGVFSAAADENTFMFAEKKNNPQALAIKQFIDDRVQEFHQPRPASASPAPALSFADELVKLATLHQNGMLSPEEFAAAKTKLISLS
jgi:hypothetical protein